MFLSEDLLREFDFFFNFLFLFSLSFIYTHKNTHKHFPYTLVLAGQISQMVCESIVMSKNKYEPHK